MIFVSVHDTPQLASGDYATIFTQPVVPNEDNSGIKKIFQGTGIRIEKHPCKNRIEMCGCESCDSDNVLVIFTQWSVHPFSGDCYWDYELICNDCGKYTLRSYAGNE
ncbi:MAG: hypothetical protein GF411_00655 [Candidatus Lokiarchaeota archaeon]|nr:hypothetical protein [Candidatus Lokiarchaeota archaeon]